MPIREYRKQVAPSCKCCSGITRSTTGVVDLGWDPAPIYIARWNPESQDHGIALLIGLGDPRGFVSARYSVEANAITVIDPDDYDWGATDIRVLRRVDVIDTPLVTKAFRVIDEIWLHDPEIQAFIEGDDDGKKSWDASGKKPES
jgi:hypothetical protein